MAHVRGDTYPQRSFDISRVFVEPGAVEPTTTIAVTGGDLPTGQRTLGSRCPSDRPAICTPWRPAGTADNRIFVSGLPIVTVIDLSVVYRR